MTLRGPYILGAGAFWSLTFRESDFLTFIQVVVTHALQGFGMKEQVFGAAYVNKSKTFVCQSFDSAFGHVSVFSNEVLGKSLLTGTFPAAIHLFDKV